MTRYAKDSRNLKFQRNLSNYLLLGALLTTLIVLPNFNYDPIGVSKLFTLTITAFSSVGLLTMFSIQKSLLVDKLLASILFTFAALLLINLFLNNYAFEERLFGVGQRQNGVVANVSLILILSVTYVLNSQTFLEKSTKVLFIGGFVVSIYYSMQKFGLDIFQFQEFYGAPSSTLGNPNFVSGFLGIITIPIAFFFLTSQKTKSRFLVVSIFVALNVWVIQDSDSIQGLFVVVISVIVIGFFRLYFYSSKLFVATLSVTSSMLLLTILAAALKFQLIASLPLSTLFSRFDYWRAAVSMTLANPLKGVGLDGYGDHYRRFRDQAAIDRFGESQVSDSPHNVFLDYFASGGLPLGICYLALFVLAVVRIARVTRAIKKDTALDANKSIVVNTLLSGYMVQSLVSPFAIGISIWGWVVLAMALSSSKIVNLEAAETKPVIEQVYRPRQKNTGRTHRKKFGFIAVLLSPVIAVMPIWTDHEFLLSVKSGDGNSVISSIQYWPQDSKRIYLVIRGFNNAGNFEKAKEVTHIGLRHNPKSYDFWVSLRDNPLSNNTEVVTATSEILKLSRRS